jgi:hypothetical protein
MTKAEFDLRSALETLRNASGKLPTRYSYTGPADFVLREGRFFEPKSLPVKIKYRKSRRCFHNARQVIRAHGFSYVEGYALHENDIPFLHAWNLDDDGCVVDTTWVPVGRAYLGVIFSPSDILKWKGSLIDNWENRWPLLRKSIAIEAKL